jgi:hypothetical protein
LLFWYVQDFLYIISGKERLPKDGNPITTKKVLFEEGKERFKAEREGGGGGEPNGASKGEAPKAKSGSLACLGRKDGVREGE